MVVGLMQLDLLLPGLSSLKEKRQIIKSMTSKVKNKYNVSVTETDHQNLRQRATIGIACVSQSNFQARRTLHAIERFVEELHLVNILRSHISIVVSD